MHQISLLQVLILDFPHKAENRLIILTIADCNYILRASALPSAMTQPPEQTIQGKSDPVLVPRGGCCLDPLATQSCINPPHPTVWSGTIIWSDGRQIASSPEPWGQISSVAEVFLRNLQAKTLLYIFIPF